MRHLRPRPGRWASAALLQAALFTCSPAFAAETERGEGSAAEAVRVSFSDASEALLTVVDGTLRARAEVVVPGEGILEGTWWVAGPIRNGKDKKFKNFLVFRRKVDNPGPVVFDSPVLPTEAEGSYALHLTVMGQKGTIKSNEIRYFVGGGPTSEILSGATAIPKVIATAEPAEGAAATRETSFSWNPVPGSAAYQIEVFEEGSDTRDLPVGSFNACMLRLPSTFNRAPLMGLMVSGHQSEIGLGEIEGAILQKGKRYLWRIVSLDGKGKVLCSSTFKSFEYSGEQVRPRP